MLLVFDDLEAVSRAAAERIVAWGRSAIAAHGRFDWLLAGGRSPVRTYEILAANYASDRRFWDRTHFYWGDERYVPPGDDQSNHHLAQQVLFGPLGIAEGNIHRVQTEAGPADRAACDYERVLPAQPDLALLGLGEDGHTASLFPGSPALQEEARRVVAVEGPKPPRLRITVTPLVLRAARHLMVLALGADKADALARSLAETGDQRQTPARLAREGVWLADRAAARLRPA